ncbi:hypothetical protein N431DRAFT_414165 [Stipitochalara longipes BDJ]|nr:hypothetical protein N431DRAFT_414165 [Stipitochalara longipes BDJ]
MSNGGQPPNHPIMSHSEHGPNSISKMTSPTSTVISPQTGAAGTRSQIPRRGISIEDVNGPVPGWPAMARIIDNKPALEAFPSFKDLNIKSLLYYQAELIRLRKELHEAEFRDFYEGDGKGLQTLFAEDLDSLMESVRLQNEKPKQWEVMERIRTVLDKYNTALLQFSQVSELPHADTRNVDSLRKLAQRVCSDGSCLTGSGSHIWGPLGTTTEKKNSFWELLGMCIGILKSHEEKRIPVPREFHENLIVPRREGNPDRLTLWVTDRFVPLFHYVRIACGRPAMELWRILRSRLCSCQLPRFHHTTAGKNNSTASTIDTSGLEPFKFSHVGEKNLTLYSREWIMSITSVLTTILACLLPVIGIVILSLVHTMKMILGLIALFNVLFAFGLVFFSPGSSKIEIFSATATQVNSLF